MIDLSKLNPGDTVGHRNGGESVVGGPIVEDGEWFCFSLGGHREDYYQEGAYYSGSNPAPFDIISITPKQFNWDDVRPGMAFIYDGAQIAIYIGKNPGKESYVFHYSEDGFESDIGYGGAGYVRAPDKDIVQ